MCGGLQGGRALKNRREGSPAGPRSAGGFSGPALTSVLPEGSCTELPRGRSLCPARGSSVQDASGWESAGSKEAWWPQHRTVIRFLAFQHPPRAWLWAKRKAGSGFLHSAKSRAAASPEVLALGFPTYLSTWAGKKKKRTAYPVIG